MVIITIVDNDSWYWYRCHCDNIFNFNDSIDIVNLYYDNTIADNNNVADNDDIVDHATYVGDISNDIIISDI